MPIKALIFDVDGTLAETEELHRNAFNQVFNELGIPWHWDIPLYTKLLEVTGGKERLTHYAKLMGLDNLDVVKTHKRKSEIYVAALAGGHLKLRDGVVETIEKARKASLKLAIATTTSRGNVDVLLKTTLGNDAISWFSFFSCGDHVKAKKPDPEIFLNALQGLGLPGEQCIAFEDSAAGLLSATGAGIATIITPSIYTSHHDFSKAIAVTKSMDTLAKEIEDLFLPAIR